MTDIPRRNRIDLATPAELAIRAAIQAVEEAGCDVRLTRAVTALSDALAWTADCIDDVPVDQHYPRIIERFVLEGHGLIDRAGGFDRCTGCGKLPPHEGSKAICAACAPPNGTCTCVACALVKMVGSVTHGRMFPIQYERGAKAHPSEIPWSVAEKAYNVYRAKWSASQTQERLAERGGFAPSEMDEFLPGWREECSEIGRLRAEVERLMAVINPPPRTHCPKCGAAWKRALDGGCYYCDWGHK